ncbi:MAG: Flp pilus assembly complex ATPase component TadA [Candidatus Omnitrophica bacterium]|nr:Flp pilus assembly complex ATPase component TadA [Candidatus Omnitrophota bacterium]
MAARTISIFSNKGGVGKTFVCVNVATVLVKAGHKTLLIDLDLQAGQDMARMLNLAPRFSIVDVLPDISKNEEKFQLRDHVSSHSSGLDFIPTVMGVRQGGLISPDNMKLFLKKAAAYYDYIIIDSGRSFTEILLSALDLTNLILLVATPDILSVYQIKWAIEILQSQHFPLKMIRLILNRAESYGGVSWQEVRTAIGVDIIARIPSDGRSVGVALNRGVPCVIDSPRSKVSIAFHELGTALGDANLYLQTTEVGKIRTVDEKKQEDFWQKFGITEGSAIKQVAKKEDNELIKLKIRIHERLVERMNLRAMTPEAMRDPDQAAAIIKEAKRIIIDLLADESGAMLSSHEERAAVAQEIANEALGLGPLEEFLADPTVTDIMVNCKDEIYVERRGKLISTGKKFMSDQHVRLAIDRIIAPLGRRIDESVPMVDARTPEGSRINAIIPPVSLRGPMLTIRKFAQERLTAADLITRYRSLSPAMAEFLEACVIARRNMLVSGGTGSGKTTLLNIISHFIPDDQRIITIEDAAELKLNKAHWARLESRTSNVEGKGAITIRDLFVNTLRMRPDRIIIGECRGAEVLDMLQAMNTGHDGSLTTVHANSAHDVLTRLNSLILLSGVELPIRATYEMIASAINIIVQVTRLQDGTRKIIGITELTGRLIDNFPETQDVFIFKQSGIDSQGRVLGQFEPTGYIPACFDEIRRRGVMIKEDLFGSDQIYAGQ